MIKAISGIEGEITIPAYGAQVGTFSKWSLTRHEDESGKGRRVFRLHAVLSYLNEWLYEEENLEKLITVSIKRRGEVDSQFRLVPMPNAKTVRDGTSQLIIEGVELWPVEQQ